MTGLGAVAGFMFGFFIMIIKLTFDLDFYMGIVMLASVMVFIIYVIVSECCEAKK